MKTKLLVFVIFILLLTLVLVACDDEKDLGTEAITTSKSGKIGVGVYSADEVAKGKTEGYTPGVTVDDKDITDDGKGLYRINFDTSGEGTVSVASTAVQSGDTLTVQAGTSVTVNVTPATDWKLHVCMLDWEVVQSNTFVMPEHDVTFLVSFVSKRHSISVGGSGGGYIITEGSDAVEETTVEFSINEADLSTDGWYYEDEDVFVESSVEDEMGNRERVNVQKVGENRFRFVMPTSDCNIVMNKRDFGKVQGVWISKRNANDQLDPIDENEIANYISYTLTMDNATIELNTRIKRHVATLTITYLNPLYEVEDVRWDGRTNSTTKVDDTRYTFTVGYAHLYIILKDKEMPDGSHTITLNNTTNGSISCSTPWAAAGEDVVVSVTPDENYVLYTLKYSDGQSEYEIYEQNGVYSFEMPDSDVEITAVFRKDLDYDNLVLCSIEVLNNLFEIVDATTVVESILINDEMVEITDEITAYVAKNENATFTITIKNGFVPYEYVEHSGDTSFYCNKYNTTVLAGNFTAAEDDIHLSVYVNNN
ncbi:MAG: hypothetical protein II867_00315 [Clostridia bacterium]|nr:hypothetical protein [Clostridia bacterium]